MPYQIYIPFIDYFKKTPPFNKHPIKEKKKEKQEEKKRIGVI